MKRQKKEQSPLAKQRKLNEELTVWAKTWTAEGGDMKVTNDWHNEAWDMLPDDIKRRAVARLRAVYKQSFFNKISVRIDAQGLNNWIEPTWAFGQGLQVRNVLRSNGGLNFAGADMQLVNNIAAIPAPIPDSELPDTSEHYDSTNREFRNWDDFYIQVVEAACGYREVPYMKGVQGASDLNMAASTPIKRFITKVWRRLK